MFNFIKVFIRDFFHFKYKDSYIQVIYNLLKFVKPSIDVIRKQDKH